MPVINALNKFTEKRTVTQMFQVTGVEELEALKAWAPGHRFEVMEFPDPGIVHIDDLGMVHQVPKDSCVAKSNTGAREPFLWVLEKDWFEATYAVVP